MLLLPPFMGEKTELSACPGSHLSWPGPRFEPRFVIKGHAHLSVTVHGSSGPFIPSLLT